MKIIRTSTIPGSLNTFCKGLFKELQEHDGYEVVAVSSPGPALDEIRTREGVKTYAVAMERHISPLKDFVSLWRLIKVFHRERPTIVHSITPKAGLLSMMAAWIWRVPVRLHTFTGLVFPTATGLKQSALESALKIKIKNKTDMRTAIATKFVAWEVPTLDALKGSKVYILREKLNNGGRMNREEKDWLTEKVNSNT